MLKRLEVTDAIREALAAIERADAVYVPGRDSASLIELPKLALADVVLAAVAAQQTQRLRRLPTRAVPVVVDIAMRPTRRRG